MHDHRDHEHSRQRRGRDNQRRLLVVLVLVGGYMVAEVAGGLLTGSLALLADAGHMLSDVAALGLSLFAMRLARRPAGGRWTYGFYRAEILAALANGAALVGISIYIFVEAYERFRDPPEVLGGWMMAVAAGGLLVNVAGLGLLHAGKGESLNVHGAWLHVLGDALGSVGAIAAALLIWMFGWLWADPAASVLIGLLVIYSSWSLLREAVGVLMESTPRGIDPDRVRETMTAVPGVAGVHDLHIWSITTGMDALSAHVDVTEGASHQTVLEGVRRALHEQFGIDHVTIQVQRADSCCEGCGA